MDANTQPGSAAPPSPLAGLQSLEEFQQQRARQFQGMTALRWFLRVHRPQLEARGALLRIAGRLWLRPERADEYILEAGAAAAQRQRVPA
jgi:hypothetical protein